MTVALERYRDLSQHGSLKAGFQFEFFCEYCDATWTSEFEPYRLDQANNFLGQLQAIFRVRTDLNDTLVSAEQIFGSKRRLTALAKAQGAAAAYFSLCSACHRQCCRSCQRDSELACLHCVGGASTGQGASSLTPAAARGAATCPSCQSRLDGGRFCAECGYDTASFQKCCPTCGAISARQTRFCPDCGHGF